MWEPQGGAQRIGVKESSASRWIESGLLSPVVVCGGLYYLERDTTEQFTTAHSFIDEAAEIAECQQMQSASGFVKGC